jgi:hypothetical protein
MPRKASATPPPAASTPMAAAIQEKKTRKPRTRSASKSINNIALFVGDSPRPKHWFDNLAQAKDALASGKIKRKSDDKIFIAQLMPVELQFTVSIGQAIQTGA